MLYQRSRAATARLLTLVVVLLSGLTALVAPQAASADTPTPTVLPIYGNSDSFDPKYTTIVINGTNLPVAPAVDIGKQTGDSKVVDVYDDGESHWYSPKWHAGYNGANCQVTIGASTPTQMILAVGDIGPLCTRLDTVTKGDNITITLYNPDGSEATKVTVPVVAPNGNKPTIDDVDKPFGPETGGQGTDVNGQVRVKTSGLENPEAFWFGGVGVLTAFYGVATTNFSQVPNTNDYMVTPPPSIYAGETANNGVSVMDADAAGTSQEACPIAIFGCNDEYFPLHSVNTTITSDPIRASLSKTLTFGGSGPQCGPDGTAGGSGQVTLSALATSDPITLNANFGYANANIGLPEAVQGSASITLNSPMQISVTLEGGIQGCVEVPFPAPFNLPGIGGMYFAIKGSISGSATLTVTINKGTYGVTGGYIPGSLADDNAATGVTETAQCVDANNVATNQCVTTAIQSSVTGSVTVSPLWLKLGPSNEAITATVAAGLSAAATGTVTYSPTAPLAVDGDICLAGTYAWELAVPKLNFSKKGNGDWLGPFSFIGNPALCPLNFNGAVATPLFTGAQPINKPPAHPAAADTETNTKALAVPGLAVTSVSPIGEADEAGGKTVTITGTGFTGATGVKFGGNDATNLTVVSDTSITVTSPAGQGVVDVKVTTPTATSPTATGDLYAYATPPGPAISAVAPNHGSPNGGTPVTITGTHLTGATGVYFGGTPATSVHVVSATQITAVSPNSGGIDSVDIQVETPNGISDDNPNTDGFRYTDDNDPEPVITGVSPSTGVLAGGNVVKITGTNFTGATDVTFGDTEAESAKVVSDTEIKATAPAHAAGKVDLTVETPSGESDSSPADEFTFSATAVGPAIASVSPGNGPIGGGTPVTIVGSGFTGATDVTFDDEPATSFTVVNATTITAVTPPGQDDVDVQVTADDAETPLAAAARFSYIANAAPPTVTGVSPANGSINGGTTIQITGANFTGVEQVLFCQTAATSFTVVSDTSITAVAPPGTGICDVTVSVAKGIPAASSAKSSADQFTYAPDGAGAVVTPTPGATPGVNITPVPAVATVTVTKQTVSFAKNGALAIQLTCTGAPCSGTVEVTAHITKTTGKGKKRKTTRTTKSIGTATFARLAVGSRSVPLKLSHAGLALLASSSYKGSDVTVTYQAGSKSLVASASITLMPSKSTHHR